MNRISGLLIPALTICFAAMASHAAENPCGNVDRAQQFNSLRDVYHRSDVNPAPPSAAELETLRQLKSEPGHTKRTRFLETTFPGDEELQALAFRDRDGDGIMDFRIGMCGEFRENDPDADCDGIANVLDASPNDTVAVPGVQSCAAEPDWRAFTNDENHNGLPDHIEWRPAASDRDAARAAKVQQDLFTEYGIVLVDRRAHMPAKVIIELDHVVRDIFRDRIKPDFAPLRVIAADLPVCGDDDFYGWASPENSTLYLMKGTAKAHGTLELSVFLRLEVLVHEITHTLQYAKDFSKDDVRGFRTENRYVPDQFHTFLELLGWHAQSDPVDRKPDIWPAVEHCNYVYPFKLTYQDKTPQELAREWETSSPEERTTKHMVSSYALKNGFEWDSEYRAAFIMNKLFDSAGQLCDSDEMAELTEALHNDLNNEGWDNVIENARGLRAYEDVTARQFNVANDKWSELTKLFLFGSYRRACTE